MVERDDALDTPGSARGFGPGMMAVTFGSVTVNTLNLAALADDFVEWRNFFSQGVLAPYVNLRDNLVGLFPFEIPFSDILVNLLVINAIFVVGARIGTYIDLNNGKELIPEYDNWRNDLFVFLAAPIFLVLTLAVSVYFLAVFLTKFMIPVGPVKAHFDRLNDPGSLSRMSVRIVAFFLLAMIPFFGLLFFATNAFGV
ncbi:hypothetical protein [Maricaulis sp.]|uniref:hypothetical protein n=1 Tax=Maricaulis sp. TaxID=1486257 RepID=UPI003A8DAD85